MLFLVGTGVGSDLTIKGIAILKRVDEIYFENYTSKIPQQKIKEIEKLTNKEIKELGREKLESNWIVQKAQKRDVALLVAGHPLIATTHLTLILECEKMGVLWKVVHNSSIHSVGPALLGLQIYKFGRSVTIPLFQKNFKPTSPILKIEENLGRGLHTLVLLDTAKGYMSLKKAVEEMMEMEDAVGREIVKELCCVGDAGGEEVCWYGSKKEALYIDIPEPITIVVPGRLDEVETEYLKMLRKRYEWAQRDLNPRHTD